MTSTTAASGGSIEPGKGGAAADHTVHAGAKCIGGKDEEEEETFERDATELLGAFKAEPQETAAEAVDAEALMKQFMLEMKAVDRDNEVIRILNAFKLNPFEKINLRFTATAAHVRKAYRCVRGGESGCKVLHWEMLSQCLLDCCRSSFPTLHNSIQHQKQLQMHAGRSRCSSIPTAARIRGLQTPSKCWAQHRRN
jgi:hypothetical protein